MTRRNFALNKAFYDTVKAAGVNMELDAAKVIVGAAIMVGQNLSVGGEFCSGTPRDTGNAVGSWMMTLDAPNLSPLGADPRSAGVGRDPMQPAIGAATNFRLGQRIFWANVVPYIEVLEYRHPRGRMLRTTKRFWPQIVEKVAQNVVGGRRAGRI